jgi:hypothetical protein
MQLPFHSYKLDDSSSSSRLVNCFGEAAPQDAKGPIILRRSPGISSFCACGTGPGRGLHVMKGSLYAVSRNSLFQVSSSAVATLRGSISGTSRVHTADNGRQLMVIAEGGGFVFADGVTVPISDTDFTNRRAGACAFVDNYAAIVDEGTGQWFITNLADFSNVDGLDFATAEGAPDDLITLAVDHRQVVLVGADSTELWDNTGRSGFPFERAPNGLIELGGIAKHGIVKQDQSVCMLAVDRTIRRLTGNTWVRISQHGVERALRNYVRIDDCEASAYTLDGHLCSAWRFPSAAATWIYDHTAQEWHEREGYLNEAWDVADIAECYGRIFVQRASTGEIGVLERAVYSEWGLILRPEWTFQNLYAGGRQITLNRIQLGIETGVGLLSGQGSDPELTLEVSKDGGRTFPMVMPTRSLGAQAQFRQRVHWDRFGCGRDIVLRMSLSDPVPLTVWDAQIDIAIGTS